MATVLSGNTVKLNNGKTVNAQQGGWYDGQQFWGGTLSAPGVINSQSNQQGAGQAVSKEVIAQTNPNNVAYIEQQQQQPQAASSPAPSGGGYGSVGTGGTGLPEPGTGTGIGYNAPAPIDLQSLYTNLLNTSGLKDKEAELTAKTQAFNDAQSKINDNPFLSEATRVGRIQKLTTDYNNDIQGLQNDIATTKADNEMQISLAEKQFDINSQYAQQALSQFNSLLQMGALNNASGEDIANITRSTGLSSDAIYSAIKAQQQKDIPTSVVSFDDGTNQGFAVINTQTGAIISKQVVAASKPPASSGGGSDVLSQERQIALDKQVAPQYALEAAKAGKTLPDMIATFTPYGMSAQDIYNIYSSVNYYHATAAQQKADKKKYGLK